MTIMPSSATTSSEPRAVDAAQLDLLVPPPGPTWRRAAGWLLFVALLAGVGWLWTSGTVTPRLEQHGWGYGGEGPVQLSFSVTNRSRVAVELVDGPSARDGLRLLAHQVRVGDDGDLPAAAPLVLDPFPVRIEPGEVVSITTWYEVTDCDAIAADTSAGERIDVQARIADGPFSGWTRTRSIDTPSLMAPAGAEPSWTRALTEHACP
jgi:hypothetical protein